MSAAAAFPHCRRRLPAYGREVESALRERRTLNVRLYANRPDPWTLARQHRATFGAGSTLVLPPDTDPYEIRWPEISSLIVNITGLPAKIVQMLAHALVRDGLLLGYLIDTDRPDRTLRVVCSKGGKS